MAFEATSMEFFDKGDTCAHQAVLIDSPIQNIAEIVDLRRFLAVPYIDIDDRWIIIVAILSYFHQYVVGLIAKGADDMVLDIGHHIIVVKFDGIGLDAVDGKCEQASAGHRDPSGPFGCLEKAGEQGLVVFPADPFWIPTIGRQDAGVPSSKGETISANLSSTPTR